jgi:phage repressor protein C with HTH and peptisase S24 domain
LKRDVPKELNENVRASLAALLNIDEAQLRGKSAPLSSRVYVKTNNGTQTQTASAVPADDKNKFIDSPRNFPVGQILDLPVFGTVSSGGATFMTKAPIDRILRPNFLAHVVDAYCLNISGDAMSPEAKNGSTVLVHPHLPPNNGDTCLFQASATPGAEYVVRVLVKQTDQAWTVRQHKPPRQYQLKKAQWPVCRIVVGNYYR